MLELTPPNGWLVKIVDRRGEGNALGNLGLAYSDLGEYQKAIEYYEQALEIAREIGDKQGEGNALCNLGVAYDFLGEYQKAIKYHTQYLEIARKGESYDDVISS